MGEPKMDLVDPDEILGMTFEVNEGPRWIDRIDQVHEKIMEIDGVYVYEQGE